MQLSYKQIGQAQPGQPVIVMLHGFLGSSADWCPLLRPYLANFSFLLLDLPGHGQSPALATRNTQCHFQLFNQAFCKALRDLGIEQYALYGYSLGGRLALYHASQNPAGLVRLMLESCHPGLKTTRQKLVRSQWQQHWQNRLLSVPAHAWLADWYQQQVFASLSPAQRERQIRQRLHNAKAKQWAQSLIGWSVVRQPNLIRTMRQPSVPTQFLVGARDPNYVKIARKLHRANPALAIQISRRGGHNVHATASRDWHTAFRHWLNSGT